MSGRVRLPRATQAALVEGLRGVGAACVAELHPERRTLRLVEVGTDGLRVLEVGQETPMQAALTLLAAQPPGEVAAVCEPGDALVLGVALAAGVRRQLQAARAQAVTLGWRPWRGEGEA